MEEFTSDPVLIAGAGPVGLTLALGLGRYGIRSVVFEAKKVPSEHSKALLITTRTLEILRGWGVLDRFLEATNLTSELSIRLVGHTKPEVTFDFEILAKVATICGVMVLPQDRTESLLLAAARESGATVHFGHELTAFTQDSAGVTVTVESQEGRKEFRGTYLIGCDGAHSTVRARLGWSLVGKTYPSRIMLADVRLPDERGDAGWPLLAPQRRGVLAGIRFAPRTWRIISTVQPDEKEQAVLNHKSIEEKVHRLFGPGPFEDIWSSVFRIHCRNSPHFRIGRIVLAGDAAHLNSPAGGQGMNAGIHDVHNLAWKLARALGGGDAETLLKSYEQERREVVVSTVERFTDLLTRVAFLPWPQLRFTLLRVIKQALRRPEIRARILPRFAMLNSHYRHSPLLDERSLFSGRRAPDVWLENANGDRQPLHALAPLEAVLMLFNDCCLPGWSVPVIEEALADTPGVMIIQLLRPDATPKARGEWRDVQGALWKAWHASGDMAVLIRPDGHVGWSRRRPTIDTLADGVRRALGEAASRGGPPTDTP